MKDLRDYFNMIASDVSTTRRHSYYWSDITSYCNYFSTDRYSVLELGCGTGDLIGNIKGYRHVAIDFSDQMVSIARKKYPNVEFQVMDASSIIIDEKFDLIIISNLIGYISDVQGLFEELSKVCHSRTKVIITYYNHLWEPLLKLGEFVGFKRKTPKQNWLSQSDIRNLLTLSGFNVYRESRRMIFPFYIPVISSFLNKIIGKLPFFKLFSISNYTFSVPDSSLFKNKSIQNDYTVSIVIPARNESGNIEKGLLRIPKFGKSQEIIFVEGNSTDDTWQTINRVANQYKDVYKIVIAQQCGKGKYDAVKTGFSIATGEVLMILDADLTVPPEDLPKFYNAIASGKGDFVNGCRLVYPMEKEAMRFLNMLGNKFFSLAFTWLLGQPFKDTLCGTKVMLRKDYLNLSENRSYFGDFDPFGDFDLLFGAYKLNLKIVELPIRYRERTYGTTNISRFKHGLILLRMCFFAAKKIKFV